jgi:hypothetical protein
MVIAQENTSIIGAEEGAPANAGLFNISQTSAPPMHINTPNFQFFRQLTAIPMQSRGMDKYPNRAKTALRLLIGSILPKIIKGIPNIRYPSLKPFIFA